MIGRCGICGREGVHVTVPPKSRCLDESACDRMRESNRRSRSQRHVRLTYGPFTLLRDPGEPSGFSFTETPSDYSESATLFRECEVDEILCRLEQHNGQRT